MKTRLFAAFSLFILLSCGDDSSELVLKATKEIYYRTDTGEKQAEKILTYDSRGNLANERYYDVKFSQAGYEIQYTYDDQNRRTRLKYIFSDQDNSYNSVLYTYENNKIKTEKSFTHDYESGKLEYYYSSLSKPDSVRDYSMSRNGYIYYISKYFTYDNHERLIEERWNGPYFGNTVVKMNTYSNNLLTETCNPLTHMPEGRNCIRNEYNAQGKIYRIYSTLTGEQEVLLEEYKYEGSLLINKKVFNQHDGFPVYNADQTIYTILVEYEYPEE